MDRNVTVGEPAPEFSLKDLEGKEHRLADQRGKIVVLDFWSADCPWSLKSDETIADLAKSWAEAHGVLIWRIASNANEDLDQLLSAAQARDAGRVLRDPKQEVADQYGAVTTPHLFVIDVDGILRYQGALDDSSWRDPSARRNYLQEALGALISGSSPEVSETPPRGCSIVRHPLEG